MKKNFALPAKNAVKSGLKKRIYICNIRDIDMENFPVAANGIISTAPPKVGGTSNETIKFVYMDVTTVTPSCKAGNVSFNGKPEVSVLCEGLTPERLEWIYDKVGDRFIVVYEDLAAKDFVIQGGPYGGLELSCEDLGIIDGKRGASLKFAGEECPEPIFFYTGDIDIEAEAV